MSIGPPRPRHIVAALFVVMHVVAFAMVFARVPLLPQSAYEDPTPSTVYHADGRLEFNMCSDCGPRFVLAGRGFGWGMPGDDRFTAMVMLANLLGEIGATILGALVEGTLGQYGKMWVVTGTFALLSTAQWWALGWTIGRAFEKDAASGRSSSERI
jgi:hypothetical protein